MLNRRILRLSLMAVAAIFLSGYYGSKPAQAYILFNRSVLLSSHQPSDTSDYTFNFDIPSTSNVGSIVFEFCDNSPSFFLACNAPAGLDASAASLASQSGNVGFSFDSADTTANKIVISRVSAPAVVTSNTYVFSNITNPSLASSSIYVKISTHAATDGSGANIDTGAVAYSIQNVFNVGAFVPPFLQLCVAVTVAPDCSSMSGDSIDLGILSASQANAGQSQFATATNDPTGYNIFALGNTMTSGNNTIPALPAPAASFPGTGQFGINLRANLIPPIGQNPVGLGTASPAANYNIPNRFTFIPGDNIASSAINTNYNRMTVSYLVNIPSNQTPGVYSTTITYLATVSF